MRLLGFAVTARFTLLYYGEMPAAILLLIIALGMLLSGVAAQPCGITIRPDNKTVSIGDVVILQCLTDEDSTGVTVMDWLFGKDSTSIKSELSGRYETRKNGTLIINNFDPSYAGLYRCVVENNSGRCVSKAVELLYFNTQSTFQVHPQDFVAFEGNGTAGFNCTYDESEYSIPPTIFWVLNGTELSEENASVVIFSYRYTSFLQIHQPTLSMHLASIRCVVHSTSDDVYSEAATLSIMSGDSPSDEQPMFSTVPIPLMYLNKGDTIIAGCSVNKAVDSIPIAWAFENHTEFLYTGINILLFDIPLSLYGHTNMLVNSTKYDHHNATYLCQLLLLSGSYFYTSSVTFFVYDSPVISTSVPADSVVTRKSGESVTFSVVINRDTPAMVKWFFNGAPLRSSPGRHDVEISNENNEEFDYRKVWAQDLNVSLQINDVTFDDMGFYQVEISNPVETVLLTYRLIVEDSTSCNISCPRGSACEVDQRTNQAYCNPSCLIDNGGCDPSDVCFIVQRTCMEFPCPSIVQCRRCEMGGADVVFVLDTSNSIRSENWPFIINFTASVARFLDIGLNDSLIGMILFGANAKIHFNVRKYLNQDSLVEAIMNTEYNISIGTRTSRALKLLRESSQTNGTMMLREGFPHIAIVITDGKSKNRTHTSISAQRLHNASLFDQVYAIGVGNKTKRIDEKEIMEIASDPSLAYFLNDFEEFTVLLQNISQQVCEPECSYTILSFTKPSFSVNENNGPAQPVLFLSQPVDCCSTISVWVNIEEDTAKEGEDFTATSPVRVLFPGGHTRAHFDVLTVDNVKLEGSEKFIVSIDPLSLPYGVVLGEYPTAEVVIMDNGESAVSFESTRYEVEEGEGHVELTIALTEAVPFNNTSLQLRAIDDTTTTTITTTGRCDYKDGPYNVTIPVGVTTFNYSLPIFNDDVYEIDETFRIEIASSDHSQVKVSRADRADVTIIDDEQPIGVSFSQTTFDDVNERDGVVTVNLTLSRPTPCCVHLYVEVEDITATRAIDYGDFDATQYIVTFPAGTSCSSFNISIRNDIESEEDETFRVTIVDMSLPFGTRLGDNITAEVVIEDNDNYISFHNGTYEQNEDVNELCIKLTFDKPALFSTTVMVFDDNGTASRGSDYAGGPYNVSITEGDMSAVFCIDITDDNDLEEDETFNLRIDTGHPDIIPMSPDQATVTILDDEYILCFIERFYIVNEGDGFVLVTLNFSRPLPYDSNVWFRYNDTASNGNHTDSTDVEVDYYTAYAWPNFDTVEKGSVSYTLNIIIMNDNRLEDNGLFSITAMSGTPPNGHTPCTTDVIILDDDDFRLEFESRSYSVSSKNRPDTPVLRLHYPEEYNSMVIFPINVTVHEINGSAYGGVDYVTQTYFCSFEDGDTTYRLIINPIDDNIVEPDETYNLTFTFVANRGRIRPGGNHTTTITIYDDDVCYVSIVKMNGKDTLDFSKQLATYVEVNITYDGNQHNVTTFTAEETRTKNRTPLPISPTERINRIDVHVPREFESMIGNVRPGRAYKNEYNFIFVEYDL